MSEEELIAAARRVIALVAAFAASGVLDTEARGCQTIQVVLDWVVAGGNPVLLVPIDGTVHLLVVADVENESAEEDLVADASCSQIEYVDDEGEEPRAYDSQPNCDAAGARGPVERWKAAVFVRVGSSWENWNIAGSWLLVVASLAVVRHHQVLRLRLVSS